MSNEEGAPTDSIVDHSKERFRFPEGPVGSIYKHLGGALETRIDSRPLEANVIAETGLEQAALDKDAEEKEIKGRRDELLSYKQPITDLSMPEVVSYEPEVGESSEAVRPFIDITEVPPEVGESSEAVRPFVDASVVEKSPEQSAQQQIARLPKAAQPLL